MKKWEVLCREIASEYLKGMNRFTQKAISERLSISLGNVNSALSNLEGINAVEIKRRSFSIIALDRLIAYWATHRKLESDIVYRAGLDMTVNEIEASMPNGIAFTAYTAYKKIYKSIPSDYSEVYVYSTDQGLDVLKRRFKDQGRRTNLIAMKMDYYLERTMNDLKNFSVPEPQVFVDLWNIRTWYAKEFADAMSRKIFGD